MKKKTLLLIMVTSIIFLTGCWDMVEINQRIFPYSIGVDINEGGDGGKYLVTISYPNINAIGKNASQKEQLYAISTTATSIFEGSRHLATRVQYPFYFKHLRVLVLGEDLAKDEVLVRQVMDGLNRDFAISKKVQMVVVEGKAKDLIETKTKRQEVIEGRIFALLKNDKTSARFTSQTLTDFIKSTDANGVALVPKAVGKKDEAKISGGALFKKYKFIGYIGELENRAISMVKGKVRRELVETEHNGVTLSYSITDLRAGKKLITTEEGMKIRISIETEGTLQEYILEDRPTINTDEILNSMEKAVEKQLKKELEKTIEVLQQEYNADALGIAEYLSKFHPRVWKEVEKDWDAIFPNIDFEVSVDVKMRRRGLIQ